MTDIATTFGTTLGSVTTVFGMVTKTVKVGDRWLDAAAASTEHHVTEIEAKYKKLAETREKRAESAAAEYMAEHMASIEDKCKDPIFRGHYEAALKFIQQPNLRVAAE